jgi:hypothetical protein
MSILHKRQLLEQIATISDMERGKLSAYSFKERSGVAGPYHKLQHWQDGKNHTRYVPADELPVMEAALAGYAQYQQLTEQYAQLVIAETRQNLAASKKTSRPSNPLGPRRGNPTTDRRVSIPEPERKCGGPTRDIGAHGRFQVSQ